MSNSSQLLDYLLEQEANIVDQLYDTPASVVAVWRALPDLAKQFVARLTFISEPIEAELFTQWTNTGNKSECDISTRLLTDLRILLVYDFDGSDSGQKSVILAPKFQISLQDGITNGSNSLGGLVPCDKVEEKYRKTIAELENYAITQRWQCLLQYLALPSAETRKAVSTEMQDVLKGANFVKEPRSRHRDEETEITSTGFQFLLMDRPTQLWSYLLGYLRYNASLSKDQTELIGFLFRLTFCSPEIPYKSESWSELINEFVQHLRELGLIYMRKRKSGWFYVTPLIKNLTATDSNERAALGEEGFLLIETNYRIYAYTDSMLQLSILSTFTDMVYRFGNMSVGTLTRESVRRAYQTGITANQIIAYLRSHAHPQMYSQSPVVPPTVADQLRLWELERDRFTFQPAYLYSNFESTEEFNDLADFAQGNNVLLVKNNDLRLAAVTKTGHEAVKSWKKKRR